MELDTLTNTSSSLFSNIILVNYNGIASCIEVAKNTTNYLTGSEIKQLITSFSGIPATEHHIVHSCKNVTDNERYYFETLSTLPPFQLKLNIQGGKGGFGSLLRGGPAGVVQKKTTNFNACRDLNGRRIRHVNQEKKLAEAAVKASKEEKKKEDVPKKRLQSAFNEDEYNEQVFVLTSSISNALEEGIQNFDFRLGKRKQVNHDIKTVKLTKLDLEFDDDDEEIKEEDEITINEVNEITQNETINDNNSIDDKNLKLNNDDTQQKIVIKKHPDEITIVIEEVPNDGDITNKKKEEEELINLDQYNEAKELEEFGMEILKIELQKRGLLCGGSLQQRAERLFSIKNLPPDQWPTPKNNKKKKKQKNKKPNNKQ